MTSATGSEAVLSASACDYCGLPAPPAVEDEPTYCCFGCRFADAITRERDDHTTARWTLTRLGLGVFFSMNVMVFTMAMWSADVYETTASSFSTSLHGLFRQLCLLLTVPVLGLLGVPLLRHAWAGIRQRQLTSELLIALGVLAAFAFSAVSVIRGSGHIYFEVACMVLVLVTLGRWFEATGRQRASASLERLERLLPDSVSRVEHGVEESVPLDQVQPGDVLRIRAGERFPCDGVIAAGTTVVDEQIFTGESLPELRQTGDSVLAATANVDGDVRMRVTAAPRGGAFGRLLEILRQARLSRGRYQQRADRIAQWFVPVVALVAAGVFLARASAGVSPAVMASLSVVLIACPCALGLATPLAVWTAMSRAAESQVLFRSGSALERLADVQAIRWDKTGTLTDGTPAVSHVVMDGATDGRTIVEITRLLTDASTHVLSRAVSKYLEERHEETDAAGSVLLTEIRSVAGAGVESSLIGDRGANSRVRLGSMDFVSEVASECPPAVEAALVSAEQCGDAIVAVGWNGRIRCVFLLCERLRDESLSTVAACHELGLDGKILTGDRPTRAARWAEVLRIPVAGGLRPEQKLDEILETRARLGVVAMVGDGINDAPAIAAADVGIALGCGADVTRDSGSVCITSSNLHRIPWAIRLARKTRRIVRQNLTWAFAYNTVGIALAATGRLNPAIAAALMLASSLVVIVNSMRLREDEQPDGRRSKDHVTLRSTTPDEMQSMAGAS